MDNSTGRADVRPDDSGAGNRWMRVRELLYAALELAPAQRATYLDSVCAGDAGLRSEIEELIKASEKSALIDAPVFAGALETVVAAKSDFSNTLVPGQKIAHYEKTRSIIAGPLLQQNSLI